MNKVHKPITTRYYKGYYVYKRIEYLTAESLPTSTSGHLFFFASYMYIYFIL
jgi:hypothetical protein